LILWLNILSTIVYQHEGCLKEAVLEGKEFIHADNGISSYVASAVADAINSNAIEGSVKK